MIRKLDIHRGKVAGIAKIDFHEATDSEPSRRECSCGGGIRRSHVTGILHRYCSICRYLRMIYGPNITVERNK